MTLSAQPPSRPSAAERGTGGAPEPDGTAPDASEPVGTSAAAAPRTAADSRASSEEAGTRTSTPPAEPPTGPSAESAGDEPDTRTPPPESGAPAAGQAADRPQGAVAAGGTAAPKAAAPETAAPAAAGPQAAEKASAAAKSRLPAHPRTMTAADGRRAAEPASPGRPGRAALVGAAVAGALLVSVPFLLLGGGHDNRSTRSENAPGTVLDGGEDSSEAGAFAMAPPDPGKSPQTTAASPKSVQRTGGPHTSDASAPAEGDGRSGPSASGKSGSGRSESSKNESGKSERGNSGSSGTGTREKSKSGSGGSQTTSHKSSTGSGAGTTGTAGTKPNLKPSGPVAFRGHQSGRCLDVPASQFTDGRPLQLWDCNGADAQKWRLESDGTIRSGGNAGLCLDVAAANFSNGTTIQLAWCNGNIAQQFTLNERNDLVNTAVGMCVGAQGGDLHAPIRLFTCNGQDNQKWSFA